MGARVSYSGSYIRGFRCRGLIKKPWVIIRVLYMNPDASGLWGLGFLNQVPTLGVLGM